MNKGSNNSIICNEVNQAIKREPSACKISGQTPVCEAGRPSVSESSQDAVVGVSNYQGSRPINSSVTNTYHHVGDKCIQVSSTTLDSSYPQVGSIDSRTLTVNSSYHSNVTGNGRPVTSAVEYHHSTNGNSRAAVSVNSVYHNSGGGSTNNNIAPSYQHNTSGSSGGGNGGVNVVTSGTVNLPSNYQESSGGSGISSSYHLHHGSGVVPCNGGTMGQVNAPPGYYYTPILNSQQTLLRPIMAAQPPLYSPLLTPQQHTYPMPHASPSAGSSYFTTLTESMRGTLTDIIPGTSDNSYKDTGQPGRQGAGLGQSGKACDIPDPRHYAVEMCQRRLQTEGSYNSSSYPPCGGDVTRPHDQRSFDDYARMSTYGEDGSGRNWDGMGGCVTGTSGRPAAPPNHMAHPYTYSYADCRLDVTWNKCVPGMSVGTMGGSSGGVENFHSQDNQIDTSEVKVSPRCSNHAVPINMNMGVATGDTSVSRSHYDYGSQIPPLFPYLTPLNYQQVPENRLEGRNEQRTNTTRSNTQLCESQVNQSSTRQLEHVHQSSDMKLVNVNVPASAQTSTTTYSHASTQLSVETSSSSVSINSQECLQQQKTMSSHQVQHCGHSTYKKEATDEDSANKCQSCELSAITERDQHSETTTVTAGPIPSVPCSVVAVEGTKQGTSTQKKEQVSSTSSVAGNNTLCLICDTSLTSKDGGQENRNNVEVNGPSTSCSMDTLTTVMSKVSVGEKLGAVLGIILPRDLLHSTAICSKCFHLINELDIMEHRLAHYRKYIITKVETTSEKYGTRLATYRKLQQQHQQQQHFHQQHLHQQHLHQQHQQSQQQQHQQQQHHHHNHHHQQQQPQQSQQQLQQQHQQQQQHMMIHYQNSQAHQQHIHQAVQLEQHNQQQSLQQLQNTQQQQQHHHHQQQQQQPQPQPQQQPQPQPQPQPQQQQPQHHHHNLNTLQQQHHLHQHSSQHALNQMQSHQIYLSHQQHQHQQHQLAYQHQHHKTQLIQEVVSQTVQQQEVITHVTQQEVTQTVAQQEVVTQNAAHPEQPPTQSSQTSVSKQSASDTNNIGFGDCDIDIEDCECNLMSESQVSSKEAPIKECMQNNEELKNPDSEVSVPSTSCSQANSEYVDINSVNSESQPVEKSVQRCSQVCVEDKHGQNNESEVIDDSHSVEEETKKVITTNSPVVPTNVIEDESRKIEDATEYHKPTLLTRNIKAKKHAKLQICRQCDQVFSNRQALVRHIERRHKAFAFHFSCDTCHKKFSSERALTRHVQLHKTYQCKLCDNIFLRKAKLKKHLENHAQESLSCKICSKECGSLQALISHMKAHTQKKKVFKCEICSKTLANNRNLKEHMRIHTGEKPFGCDNCGRRFSHQSNMQAHHDMCTGHFRYKCQVCGKGFALESVYQRHLGEHKGQFAHCCSVCGRGFSKASGLQAHLPIHSSQRQTYTCQVCSQTFTSRSGYNSHVASHSGEDGYVCPVCGKTVIRPSDLKDHLHRHAGNKTHTCPVCDASFYYRANMNHHVRTAHRLLRPYTCKICDKSFSSSYNYKSHIRIHSGEKPHQCKSCGKTFSSKGNYNRHLKCHVTQGMAPLSTETE